MRLTTARLLLPLVLAVPVTTAGADTLSPTYHRHHARPVSAAQAPVPVRKPAPTALEAPEDITASPPAAAAPPAQLATPAPVTGPNAKPPAQSVGVTGVPANPTQTR